MLLRSPNVHIFACAQWLFDPQVAPTSTKAGGGDEMPDLSWTSARREGFLDPPSSAYEEQSSAATYTVPLCKDIQRLYRRCAVFRVTRQVVISSKIQMISGRLHWWRLEAWRVLKCISSVKAWKNSCLSEVNVEQAWFSSSEQVEEAKVTNSIGEGQPSV